MKYLLIISCLLFTSVGWSKDVDFKDLIKIDGLYYEKFTEKPFTGKVTGIKQGKIRKGIKKGKWIEYSDSGIIKKSYTIKRGKQDGEAFRYNRYGELRFKGNFKKGKKDGEYLVYDEDGQVYIKVFYKDGILDDEYFSQGKKGNFNNSKLEGEELWMSDVTIEWIKNELKRVNPSDSRAFKRRSTR